MPRSVVYQLKGHGRIEPAWMRDCFAWFKSNQVCIRKLVLMQNGDPSCYAMLEIHFIPPPENPDAFMTGLQQKLDTLPCQKVLSELS